MNVEEAISHLKAGEPVAIPTETVYGLAAPIFDVAAVKKIFFLKGRPSDNPLIAHVSSIAMAERIAENVPEWVSYFWPGPLTLVLPKKACVPAIVSGGHPTVAVRMPSHPLALQLIEQVGPLVAPSANLSGKPSPTCARHVLEDFAIPVLDGGPCQIGIESTVLSLVHVQPTLLRPGAITQQQLEDVLKMKIALPKNDEPILSPGMKYRHYAPKARVHIVGESIPAGAHVVAPDARTFYAELRRADELGLEEIWIHPTSDPALMNRLLRAAGKL